MKAFFAAAAPYQLAQRWTDGLWDEKAQRIARLRRESDKALALTAHRLMYYALKTVYDIAPQPQDFGRETNGKPFFIARPGIHFNISHSGAMAMCALHNESVGADIEKIRTVGEGVPERVMSAAEHRQYLSADDRQSMFFQIWTLKEAFVKCSGTGLGIPLGSFTVCPSGGNVITDTGCTFWSVQPSPGYQAAICARDGDAPDFIMVSEQQLVHLGGGYQN